MGGGGKGGAGDSTTTVRFAPYIEERHEDFLNTMAAQRGAVIGDSPFDGYSDLEIDCAFFGTGYVLCSFPSLYDMFGKFMAGLDIEVIFNEVFEDTIDGPVINNLVAAEATRIDDEIIETQNPRFTTGMRDINSVMSSTFVVGRAMMETARTKALERFSTELRYRLIPTAVERWKTHLQWNENTVKLYADILKFYIMARIDVDNHNYEIHAKDLLWPFTVLDFERAGLGALTGAQTASTDVAGRSTTQQAIGGAMSGAAAGFMVGGAPGAVIGGVLGLAGGLLG